MGKENEEFGRGREDGRNASFGDELFHGLEEIFHTVTPSCDEHKAYDAGWDKGITESPKSDNRDSESSSYESYSSDDSSESSSPSSKDSSKTNSFLKWASIILWISVAGGVGGYLSERERKNQIITQDYASYSIPMTKKDSLEALADYVSEKSGEDFDFWNPLFKTDSALSLYRLATLTADENSNASVIFAGDSIQLYIPDLKGRLTQFNLPKSSIVRDINHFYLDKVKLLEDKTNAEDNLKGFYSDATEGYRGKNNEVTNEENPSEVPYSDTTYQQEGIQDTSKILDPETGMPREFLPQEPILEFRQTSKEPKNSVPEPAVNNKIEDPLKIYEALNPNSEFSQETPSNHAPVVVERRDENNNIISQEKKYLTREELEESSVTEIEINYPDTGNRYPISREKYPKFYKKLDKNKDGKLDLEEIGRYQNKINTITKKYPEGDIESIVREFLK